VRNPPNQPQDFSVRLADLYGKSRAIRPRPLATPTSVNAIAGGGIRRLPGRGSWYRPEETGASSSGFSHEAIARQQRESEVC